MARIIRVGMLGYGFMGRCHTHAYRTIEYMYPRLSVHPQLAALCGRNAAQVQQRADGYGFERTCSDWHELIADPTIELFDNCGPDPVHVEPTIAALQAGKLVICEKPLAVSLSDARRMREAAERSGRLAMCMFNYRFFPAVCLARQLIRAGRLGPIRHMRVSYLQMAGHDPHQRPEEIWYSAWPHSGVLQGIGSHAIDQCRFLVGEIAAVSGSVRTFVAERALPSAGNAGVVADEAASALLEFSCGAMGVLEASAVAYGHKNRLSWEINGAYGSLQWNLEQPSSLGISLRDEGTVGFKTVSVTDPEHPHATDWWPPGHHLGWEHGHIIGIASSCIVPLPASHSDEVPTFLDGCRVAEVIDSLRKAGRAGRRVELSSSGDSPRVSSS